VEYFIEGFRLGARLGIEVMDNGDGCREVSRKKYLVGMVLSPFVFVLGNKKSGGIFVCCKNAAADF